MTSTVVAIGRILQRRFLPVQTSDVIVCSENLPRETSKHRGSFTTGENCAVRLRNNVACVGLNVQKEFL